MSLISKNEIEDTVKSYDVSKIQVAALGSHSALDIADGAKDEGFETLIVCQEGREKVYKKYRRIIDHVIVLPNFSDITKPDIQDDLRKRNVIFVPHRSFSTYVHYDDIENKFKVPLFGNRFLLRTEERDVAVTQYDILKKAEIRYPKLYASPEEIDGPVIVKVHEANRKIERAFFTASSHQEYLKKSSEMIDQGIINVKDLASATIEELILGAYFNFNYFYSPLENELEFLGIDRRLQTNLFDFVNLPAKQQLEIDVPLQNIEIGHTPATIRESLLEKVFQIGEKFVKTVKEMFPPGPIGPFALQSSITKDLDIVVYDVSPRVPGSPIISTTSPYTKYFFGHNVSTGRRIAMEIKKGIKTKKLFEVVT